MTLLSASTLSGDKVVNGKGENLGDIKDLMIDVETGQVAYAVLEFGGILGLGGKLFAVPLGAMRLDTENRRFIFDWDKERLENAPGFDKDHWPDFADREWAGDLHSYYRVRPYWD